ncbi:Gfo/Idh/MocA family oxidoreductase [Candidatus Pacearchaeota archaeon]|nr:Gfo/Idh/MocA family oxidoreductase [Candidatus Pacearchaeota archaeon]
MVNFGIVGCGRISGKHIASLKQIPNAKIVAVCDINQERCMKAANECMCKSYSTYEEMLQDKDVEVVNILTPSGLHPTMAIQAAKAGKHVVCEKPIALTIKDANHMVLECEKAGVLFFTVKQNRYNPPIIHLKKAIDEGRFGRLFLANVTVRWSRDKNYYKQDAWRGTIKYDGGVLLNQTSHHIDMLQWMLGDVISVICKKANFFHDIEVEDSAVAILKFRNGAYATFEGTTCTFPRDMEGSISILGEKGSAKVGGFAMNKMEHWQFTEPKEEDQDIIHTITNPPNVYGFGHLPLLKSVVETITSRNVQRIDGDEGLKTLKIIIAMLKSAKENREVFLKELNNEDEVYYY